MNIRKEFICLAVIIFCLNMGAGMYPSLYSDEDPPNKTTWIGNTWGGKGNKWVQGHIQDMTVTPDGMAIGTTWWDESGHEQCGYRNGDLVGVFNHRGHEGGRTVAARGNYVYFGIHGFGGKDPMISRYDISKPVVDGYFTEAGRFPIQGKIDLLAPQGSAFKDDAAWDNTQAWTAYDGRGIHLKWQVKEDTSPFINKGTDWKTLYKTGDAFDLVYDLPGVGTVRLLLTVYNDQPIIIKYVYDADGTQVSVKRLEGGMGIRRFDDFYVIQTTLSPELLGIDVKGGAHLNLDFGVLRSNAEGTETVSREYWKSGSIADAEALPDERAQLTLGGGVPYEIRGLAADESELYVAIPGENMVRVFDREKMEILRSFQMRRPSKLAVAKDGTLWILQNMKDRYYAEGVPTRIVHYKPDGTRLPEEITDVVDPREVELSYDGKLLVGENGPRNCVLIYDVTGQPTLEETFGRSITSGEPGVVEPDKFDGITGLGTDADGNFYVACDGRLQGKAGSDGTGTVLRSLTPDAELNWELYGIEFVDCAAVDPASDGEDIYTDFHHYKLDFAKEPGKDATWVGYSLDRFNYPKDMRITQKHHYVFAAARIEGQLFMYITGQWPGNVYVYRFDGEMAIPCAGFQGLHDSRQAFKEFPGTTIPEDLQGQRIGSIWIDKNGDGHRQPEEYEATSPTWFWGRSVDSKGDLWCAGRTVVAHFPCEGLNEHGVPVYKAEKLDVQPAPEPFNHMTRLSYDRENDTMYIAGWTTDLPRKSDERDLGRVLACYDNWSQGNRDAKWLIPLSERDGGVVDKGKDGNKLPKAMVSEGEYVFVGTPVPAKIYVFDKENGEHVTTLWPGPEVGSYNGWLDIPMAITAFKRTNGEYLVLMEEDARHKVTILRWKP